MANIVVSSGIHEFMQAADYAAARTVLGLGDSATKNVGTAETDVASGNHTHAQLHDAATVNGNGISIVGQQISLDIGTGATQVASGNHTHAQLHDAATVNGNGISIVGQQISLDIGTSATQVASGNHGHTSSGTLGITIDGAGSVISTGLKGYLKIPYNCTITSSEIVADQTGNIVIDIWRNTYANLPTDANSITASATPTLSSAQKSQDLTLNGWQTSLTGGHYLAFNVDSATTVTQATLTLTTSRTL